MLIHSLRKEYAVLRILKTTRDIDISVCRDSGAKKEQTQLIVTMKNPDLIYRLMPFFVEQRKNNAAFQDFQECFAQDGKLYLVFVYRDKPLLSRKIAEGDYSFRERLEIGKSLLSWMVLQQIPDCIQYDVLQEDNLLLDDALQVYFNIRWKMSRAISPRPAARFSRSWREYLRGFFRLKSTPGQPMNFRFSLRNWSREASLIIWTFIRPMTNCTIC
jgi:hypothetical protein